MKYAEYLKAVDRYATGDVAESCISSLFECFRRNGIDLGKLPKFESSTALRRGLPFSYISQEAYECSFLAKVCNGYFKNHEFNENDFAEVSAVALLFAMKAKTLSQVQRSSKKSYDFDVIWEVQEIEVEVTRPGKKDEWEKRVTQSHEIIDFAASLKIELSIRIYVVDLLSAEDFKKLKELIASLSVVQRIEKPNKWLLISELPTGDPTVLFENIEDTHRPYWWPEQGITGFTMSGMVAGPNQVEALPRIWMKFACPFNGYINKAKNKAKNFQGSRNKPFILVLDVNELGNPFGEFKRNLDHYFSEWKHISAVLIFVNHYSGNEIGWEFQLFINPFATRRFDEATQNILLEYTERKRAVKLYA